MGGNANHVHLLLTPRRNVSEIMRQLKGATARKLISYSIEPESLSGNMKAMIDLYAMRRSIPGPVLRLPPRAEACPTFLTQQQ